MGSIVNSLQSARSNNLQSVKSIVLQLVFFVCFRYANNFITIGYLGIYQKLTLKYIILYQLIF